MLPPATVRSELASGYRLVELWCNACLHHVEIAIDDMPPDLPIPDIALRYRCSTCGGRNITSRMSIPEFYRIAEERRNRT